MSQISTPAAVVLALFGRDRAISDDQAAGECPQTGRPETPGVVLPFSRSVSRRPRPTNIWLLDPPEDVTA